MNYAILHTVSYDGPDNKHTTTTEVKGDTLTVNDQGHLFVEYVREHKNGKYYRTVNAIFKDWERAVPVPEYSSTSSPISSDAKEPGKLTLNEEK